MPLPGKPVFMKGGRSVPTSSDVLPGDSQSFGCSGINGYGVTVGVADNSRIEDWSPGNQWNPRHSMAFNSAKGLLNPVGQNNCFLNSAVQVLWHLDVFRRNFRLLSGHACLGNSCIFCALKVIFTQYQFSERSALPADSLRRAMAQTYADEQRFQMGFMDDASECFENILSCIHHHLVSNETVDDCQAPHCITHQKFTMKIKEQVICQCRATSGEVLSFNQMVHYVATTSLMMQVQRSRALKIEGQIISFGQLLQEAKSDGETRKCSANCGRLASIHRTLTNSPEVISIGFVWDSERPSFEHIRGVVNAISTELRPSDLFNSVTDSHLNTAPPLKLVGLVCYYSRHYSTFFFHSKMKTWVLFDDANVQEIGPDWRSVADRCCQGHYQPLLLHYSSENMYPLGTATAPRTTFLLNDADCNWKYGGKHPCKVAGSFQDENDKKVLLSSQYNYQNSSVKVLDSWNMNNSASVPQNLHGRDSADEWIKYDSDEDSDQSSRNPFVRQPSYLYAITGTKSFYRDEPYSSYIRAIDNVSVSGNKLQRKESVYGPKTVDQEHPLKNKSKLVQFSERVVGITPGGKVESFQMLEGSAGNKGVSDSKNSRNFPHHSYVHSKLYPYQSRQKGHPSSQLHSHDMPKSIPCNPPPGLATLAASTGGLSSDVSATVAKQNASKGNQVNGRLERVVEDNDDWMEGGKYINAKTVQQVLSSQGFRSRSSRSRINVGQHKDMDDTSSSTTRQHSLNTVSLTQNGSTRYQGHVLNDSLESMSFGSHKDSGYRSGDSNGDHCSISSVTSSPSLDSGEFLPARNAQLIAQDFRKMELKNWTDRPSGCSNPSSYPSSHISRFSGMQRSQKLNPIHEVDNHTLVGSSDAIHELKSNSTPGSLDSNSMSSKSSTLQKDQEQLPGSYSYHQSLTCGDRLPLLQAHDDPVQLGVSSTSLNLWRNRVNSSFDSCSSGSKVMYTDCQSGNAAKPSRQVTRKPSSCGKRDVQVFVTNSNISLMGANQ